MKFMVKSTQRRICGTFLGGAIEPPKAKNRATEKSSHQRWREGEGFGEGDVPPLQIGEGSSRPLPRKFSNFDCKIDRFYAILMLY